MPATYKEASIWFTFLRTTVESILLSATTPNKVAKILPAGLLSKRTVLIASCVARTPYKVAKILPAGKQLVHFLRVTAERTVLIASSVATTPHKVAKIFPAGAP